MSDVSTGVMAGLFVIYSIMIFLMYWKSVLIVFDGFKALLQSIIVAILGGGLLMALTFYFWKAAIVVIILAGLGFAFKASTASGKITAIILALFLAVIIGKVGADSTGQYSGKTIATTYDTVETPASDVMQGASDSGEDDLYQDASDLPVEYDEEYIADSVEYRADEVSQLSKDDVEYLINEMYAYHGYIFSSDKYKQIFGSMEWYTPSTDDMSQCEAEFNNMEKQNMKTLTDYAKSQGWR